MWLLNQWERDYNVSTEEYAYKHISRICGNLLADKSGQQKHIKNQLKIISSTTFSSIYKNRKGQGVKIWKKKRTDK